MRKSPYLSNPNILAHPDRVVQTVALDMTAQETYLAGSPISAEGKLANDETAIGILLYDVHKAIGGRSGVVVISGRINQEVAAAHSGVAISDDCKAALIDVSFTGDGCRMGGGSGGVSSWNDLTDKPFYKEQSETVLFEQEITTNEQGVYLAGFDFIDLEIDKDYVVTFGGVNYPCTAGSISMNPYLGNVGLINPEFSGTDPFFIMPSEGGAIVLPDFANQTVSVKISTVSETIKTIDPEFLPAGVGGGGVLRVNVTAVDGDVTNLTADKTYAEIVSAFEAGSVITAYFVLGTGYVFTLSQRGETHFLFHSIFTMSGSPVPMFLQIRNDDNVMLIESAFS